MWTSTRFTERFGCRYPIVQGPMVATLAAETGAAFERFVERPEAVL